MAITLIAAASLTGSSSLSVAPPAGWSAGQFALLSVVVRNGGSASVYTGSITPAAGWTTIHKGDAMWVGYRFLQAGDTTWSFTSPSFMASEMVTFTGVDATNPVDVSAFAHMRCSGMQGTAGGVSPPVNPTHTDDYLVLACGGGYSSGGTPTAPSGWTALGVVNSSFVFLGFFGQQSSSAATQGSAMAGTTVMAASYSNFAGTIALKTSGSSAATPAAAFPYLAGTLNTFTGTALTSTSITAGFGDLASPGDLMFAHVATSGTAVISPPDSTWNAINLITGVYSWWRVSKSGDPATFNFSAGTTTTANVHTQVVKSNLASALPIFDTAGRNTAAASTTTPSTPALTSASTGELLLTRITNNSGTTSTMTYVPSGSNIGDAISTGGPSESFGHLVNSPSPSPTASATKSAAGSNSDTAAAFLVRLINITPQAQQMILS
ncbi:hypothetical protein [Burkholderia ambifaria]|uniref:hypothetical protein n=1 Tax=Burkholderia ambifaria TaxID=152480 RepID=UPI00158CCBBF|nr:hypothetical protein [Burkholderia ambifaria]MBR8344643.1 hypothetical protein [Burkholderia ambifaria]